MWSTTKFSESLISSIINLMNENNCSEIPFEFLANRSDYQGCAPAKTFYKHGYRSLTVENGNLILNGTWDYLGDEYKGQTFNWIITEKYYGYEPKTIHHNMMTEDLLALVQIAYDTIGSVYFPIPGRNVEECIADRRELTEIEKEYEARRNEVA